MQTCCWGKLCYLLNDIVDSNSSVRMDTIPKNKKVLSNLFHLTQRCIILSVSTHGPLGTPFTEHFHCMKACSVNIENKVHVSELSFNYMDVTISSI